MEREDVEDEQKKEKKKEIEKHLAFVSPTTTTLESRPRPFAALDTREGKDKGRGGRVRSAKEEDMIHHFLKKLTMSPPQFP